MSDPQTVAELAADVPGVTTVEVVVNGSREDCDDLPARTIAIVFDGPASAEHVTEAVAPHCPAIFSCVAFHRKDWDQRVWLASAKSLRSWMALFSRLSHHRHDVDTIYKYTETIVIHHKTERLTDCRSVAIALLYALALEIDERGATFTGEHVCRACGGRGEVLVDIDGACEGYAKQDGRVSFRWSNLHGAVVEPCPCDGPTRPETASLHRLVFYLAGLRRPIMIWPDLWLAAHDERMVTGDASWQAQWWHAFAEWTFFGTEPDADHLAELLRDRIQERKAREPEPLAVPLGPPGNVGSLAPVSHVRIIGHAGGFWVSDHGMRWERSGQRAGQRRGIETTVHFLSRQALDRLERHFAGSPTLSARRFADAEARGGVAMAQGFASSTPFEVDQFRRAYDAVRDGIVTPTEARQAIEREMWLRRQLLGVPD